MRELFDDLFNAAPVIDPVEAVRRGARAQRRKRFYENAQVSDEAGGFGIALDGRAVRTPGRRPLRAPTRALADALAGEWAAQGSFIAPLSMPLTRLANSIIDGVAQSSDAVAAGVARYLASDMVLYRAEGPEGLVARQAQSWDPVLDWARDTLGAEFVLARGVVYASQPAAALAAAAASIPSDPWKLGAVHAITTLTGSALIALAVLAGRLSAEAAWAAAHVDEDWNMETWGGDQDALERRALRFAEMKAAVAVLQLTG